MHVHSSTLCSPYGACLFLFSPVNFIVLWTKFKHDAFCSVVFSDLPSLPLLIPKYSNQHLLSNVPRCCTLRAIDQTVKLVVTRCQSSETMELRSKLTKLRIYLYTHASEAAGTAYVCSVTCHGTLIPAWSRTNGNPLFRYRMNTCNQLALQKWCRVWLC